MKLSPHVNGALFFAVLVVSTGVINNAAFAIKPVPGSVGMNLSILDVASTQIPFVDLFKRSSKFEFAKKWMPADAKPPAQPDRSALDSNGWVASLAYDEQAYACIFNNNTGYFPAGIYNVFYEGQGDLEIDGGTVQEKGPN